MIPARWGVGLLALLLVAASGCATAASDQASAPLQAAASVPAADCPNDQGYQHPTLGFRVCYPTGWTVRDYTAEPGSGGALSVVAFGPNLPVHVPQAGFQPPLEVRVLAEPRETIEASVAQGNQVSPLTVAQTSADRIDVVADGPAKGEAIVILEHDGDAFEIEKGPGDGYRSEFAAFIGSFVFAQPGG